MTANGAGLLEGRSVTKRFGGLVAVNNVDFVVRQGEMVGLIGPNGSGKTTLFDCLSRVQSIDEGQVLFQGIDITNKKPHQVAHLGMARTFQVIRVYRKLTVLENLLVSRQWRGESLFSQMGRANRVQEDKARELIEFVALGHLVDSPAGTLSGGQRRLLEIGMALMPDPDLILLDEAASGVNPTLVETIKDRIRILNEDHGKTFLLVEHDMRFISDLCSRVYVLNYGELLVEGTPDEVMANEAVIEAYFGA
ncbi:MAG: ABC transporter ATP-binding protein [Acidimicrobiia bacterium]|nr:ABC transporter ATP-binding protein [Acidimicrobiia bacterium]